jgi:hypothetical protein
MTATAANQPPKPGPAHRRLGVFIGRWINEGRTVASADAPSVKILTSDVYEWAPGGFFVHHYAYGLVGDLSGGGIEIIGYDAARDTYSSHFFDSQGNVVVSDLTFRDGVWTWTGPWAGEMHRATSVFSDDGKTQACLHERSVDGVTWEPSMEVTLTKAE